MQTHLTEINRVQSSMNSLRIRYHAWYHERNVDGTQVPNDYIETISIVMEHMEVKTCLLLMCGYVRHKTAQTKRARVN
jgi:hypothetical protein